MPKTDTIEAHAVVVNDGPCAPATTAQLDPAWDRARELLQTGKALAIELADEIERLRSTYSLGRGGDRRGSKSQVVTLNHEGGFHAKLEQELGLHRQQASRILESADYQRRILLVAKSEVGSELDYVDSDGAKEKIYVRDEVKALAQEAVKSWGLPFASSPARQWAGIIGGGSTRGAERAPVNHAKVLDRSVRSFANCLEHWNRINPVSRAEIEMMWEKMCEAGLIPDTFIAAIMRHSKGRK